MARRCHYVEVPVSIQISGANRDGVRRRRKRSVRPEGAVPIPMQDAKGPRGPIRGYDVSAPVQVHVRYRDDPGIGRRERVHFGSKRAVASTQHDLDRVWAQPSDSIARRCRSYYVRDPVVVDVTDHYGCVSEWIRGQHHPVAESAVAAPR